MDEFDWYLFPSEIQRMLPIIMMYAQQPVGIACFGSTTCNRDTFKYVSMDIRSISTLALIVQSIHVYAVYFMLICHFR